MNFNVVIRQEDWGTFSHWNYSETAPKLEQKQVKPLGHVCCYDTFKSLANEGKFFHVWLYFTAVMQLWIQISPVHFLHILYKPHHFL